MLLTTTQALQRFGREATQDLEGLRPSTRRQPAASGAFVNSVEKLMLSGFGA